jgi:hypothetical protein
MTLDRQWSEIEFRDGKRTVPDYIAALLTGIETHRLTYDDAIAEANRKTEADFINAQQERVLAAHFRELR